MGLFGRIVGAVARFAEAVAAEQANLKLKPVRPLPDLIVAFRRDLVARGVTEKYAAEHVRYLERLLPADLDVRDLDAEFVGNSLAMVSGLRARIAAKSAFFGLCAFLVRTGYMASNPVSALPTWRRKKLRPPRRSLSPEEFARLLAIAENGLEQFARCAYYLAARTTGLRCGALASSTWANIDLERGLIRYFPKGGKAENWKPIPSITVLWLSRLMDLQRAVLPAERLHGARVFPFGIPTLKTFYRDLERAGIPKLTADGRLDRHALRVSYITAFSEASPPVPAAIAQHLADHADVRLTLETYTRLPTALEREAVERTAPRLPFVP